MICVINVMTLIWVLKWRFGLGEGLHFHKRSPQLVVFLDLFWGKRKNVSFCKSVVFYLQKAICGVLHVYITLHTTEYYAYICSRSMLINFISLYPSRGSSISQKKVILWLQYLYLKRLLIKKIKFCSVDYW